MRRVLRPLRRVIRRLRGRERPVILMYHRVATVACDPWQLAVQPQNFAAQIARLAESRRVVPLGWLVRELAHGRMPYGTAAITFDDGYADLLTEAKPVLDRYGCPATMFLTTGAIDRTENFWWDDLAHIVLAPATVPPALDIDIGGRSHRWTIGDSAAPTRDALHLELWKLLRPLSPAARRQCLDALARWADSRPQAAAAHRALTAEEARRLIEPGFIDVGAHSVTHPSMPALDPTAMRIEATESKQACEALAGVRVDAFAYPFGDHDEASVDCVRSAGFAFACSTEHGALTERADVMRLPRLAVPDCGAGRFSEWLAHAAA